MSNVLLEERRKAVWRMYRDRFVIAGSLMALLLAALSALALLPSYLALTVDQGTNVSTSGPGGSVQSDQQAIAQGQALIATLSPLLAATTTPTDAIEQALSAEGAQISANAISYTSGTPGTLVITGSASDPAAIQTYEQALQANPFFTSVSVPVSDLAGSSGNQFSVTLTGNF